MTTVGKADNENNLQTGYETNPLMADRKAKLEVLQQKAYVAKSIYQQATQKYFSACSLRNTMKANSIWAYNMGNKVDMSELNKFETLVGDAETARYRADIEDTNANTNLFIAIT